MTERKLLSKREYYNHLIEVGLPVGEAKEVVKRLFEKLKR